MLTTLRRVAVIAILLVASLPAHAQTVVFRIDMRGPIEAGWFDPATETIGVRGAPPPLSWEQTAPAMDDDGDSIYEARLRFASDEADSLSGVYKFKVEGTDNPNDGWEEGPNRTFVLKGADLEVSRPFDAHPPSLPATVLTTRQLQDDFAIMKQAYQSLHPGLYRYTDKATMDRHFDTLERHLQQDMSLSEAYLAFSRFLAKVKCGHTYANFWNQTDTVKQEVFARADKVPFTFRLIGRRMIVTQNASEDERLTRGTEILSINGIPTLVLLDSLITLVKADGANDAKRLHDLQVTGIGDYEAFDVYFPLVFPVEKQAFEIEARDRASNTSFMLTTEALTRSERSAVLEERYGQQPATNDDLWQFKILDDQTAYLQLGTFVTWRMEMDWKAFLKAAFEEINQKKISNLILDIRGNEGGADEVNAVLSRYLVSKSIQLERRRELLRYRTVPPELDPYLDTWDDSFRNREKQVEALGDGFYTWKNARTQGRTITPSRDAYQGTIYVLVDAANSSATFNLASLLKRHKLATLVGQETGGNRRGITGGQFFFLRLPHSTLEMDLPLVGYYPLSEQPDEGLMPDVYVEPTVEDVINGIDTELEVVKTLIAQEP